MRDHGLRILDLGAFAPDQILRDQRVGTLVSVHIDRRLAILRKRHLRQIDRNVKHLRARCLRQILRLRHDREHHQIGGASGIRIVHTERKRGVKLLILENVVIILSHLTGVGGDHRRAIGCVFLPGAHEFGTILDIDGDTLRAYAVAVFNLVAIAFLQYDVAVVFHRHRGFEGDSRLLTGLARGGHTGDLIHLRRGIGRRRR